MKHPVRKLLTALLALVFLFSMVKLLTGRQQSALAADSYQDALAIASAPKSPEPTLSQETAPPAEPEWVVAPLEEEDPYAQELAALDLAALRQVNPDVVGWIWIPDTKINYPLMQGRDNEYYLNYTWDNQKSVSGSIFLEYQLKSDLTEYNTIVYGHNMDNGSMFASLRYYCEQAYWEAHPYVYILSDQGVYRYEIFSTYMAEVESNAYGISFANDRAKTRFLYDITKDSVITTDIQPELTDRVLTLSTCSGIGYSTRWVVHARLPMILTEG